MSRTDEKYPNGYKEKLDYHREKLRAATSDKDIKRCLESIQYFERKQLEWENANMKTEVEELGSTFKAKGYVYGIYWGGGEGAYPTISFEEENMDRLKVAIQAALDDGSMDSGMGYQSLIGAILEVEEIKTIKYKDEEYKTKDWDTLAVGDLNPEQMAFVEDCMHGLI